MKDYGKQQTTLIHANVELIINGGGFWQITVYDEDNTYSKWFCHEFPIPKDLGETLVEFLEKYYVKEVDENGNSIEGDKDCE